MAYTTEWTHKGIIWTYSGTITGAELIQSNMEVYGDARFDDLRYQIVDMRKVSANEVSDSDMLRLAHLDMVAARTNSKIRIAVIHADHLNEAYLTNTNETHWPTLSFESFEDAQKWATST
jgi:hypothetical protein